MKRGGMALDRSFPLVTRHKLLFFTLSLSLPLSLNFLNETAKLLTVSRGDGFGLEPIYDPLVAINRD